jgi:hypothetical protein
MPRDEQSEPGATRRQRLREVAEVAANKNLELAIEDVLFRSPGLPSLKPLVRYKSFQYQADNWTTHRRGESGPGTRSV